MDSKEYEVNNVKMRISVLETTSPALILSRKDSLMNKSAECRPVSKDKSWKLVNIDERATAE
jgi:inorganic pyrophosphatase/exopolyphosphatase